MPSSQRTVAFEKASVLFNVGALYTQIGTRQDRLSAKGLDAAVDNFLRSAGTFQYILENFTNAPSMDLNPATLEFLVHLMCAQARECLFEKGELGLSKSPKEDHDINNVDTCLTLSQEAAHVSLPQLILTLLFSSRESRCKRPHFLFLFEQMKTQCQPHL